MTFHSKDSLLTGKRRRSTVAKEAAMRSCVIPAVILVEIDYFFTG
jgi:hypothetical protein